MNAALTRSIEFTICSLVQLEEEIKNFIPKSEEKPVIRTVFEHTCFALTAMITIRIHYHCVPYSFFLIFPIKMDVLPSFEVTLKQKNSSEC